MLQLQRRDTKRGAVYAIVDGDGRSIAKFGGLSDAGAALRYLNGVPMGESELAKAVNLLDAIDETNEHG